jgi:hypothetical protein
MMKTSLALLGVLLCTLPLSAHDAGRRVVAACELTTATVIPSGRENSAKDREYAIRVTNSSPRAVALPRSPNFGWRVESLRKKDWRFKAEGGPVRRISADDPHIVVSKGLSGQSENMVEIAPTHGETFLVYLPEVDKALQSDSQFSHYKLTLYWAASQELAKVTPTALPCGLTAEWIIDVQRMPPPK